MKKLLIPLIILLLVIGYFMSRSGEHKAKEAYDSMNQPKSEQMNDSSMPSGSGSDSTSPNGTSTPPDGMGNPDAQMLQDSSQMPDDGSSGSSGSMNSMGSQADKAAEDASKEGRDAAEGAENMKGNSSDTDTGTDEGMESNSDQPQR